MRSLIELCPSISASALAAMARSSDVRNEIVSVRLSISVMSPHEKKKMPGALDAGRVVRRSERKRPAACLALGIEQPGANGLSGGGGWEWAGDGHAINQANG